MSSPRERIPEVEAALEIALRDFQHPTPVDLQIDVSSDDELVWIGGTGIPLDVDDAGDALLWRVADLLQEQVFDQLEQTWGEARPPCPGHQHPAIAELLGGEAWWVCPRTRVSIARIGQLGVMT
jgi:hypothetical protein